MISGETSLPTSAPLALIVEDDLHAARIARDMLEMLGYRSRHAGDANQALYALSEGPPSLILLDICLPEMDGIGLMKVARRVRNMDRVPVVAASAVYPTNGPILKLLGEAGVDTFLSKPFMLDELRRAIDEARSLALKHGPPPQATMTDGRVQPLPGEGVAPTPAPPRAFEAPVPPSVKPPADPSPPRRPAQPPPAPPVEPALQGLDDRLADSNELAKPSPWQAQPAAAALDDRFTDTAEWRRGAAWSTVESGQASPAPTSLDASLRLNEVIARGQLGDASFEFVIDDCTRDEMRLRTMGDVVEAGATLKLEIDHRVPVQDAMTDVHVRALVRITRSEPFGRGCILRTEVSAARPPEQFNALVRYFSLR